MTSSSSGSSTKMSAYSAMSGARIVLGEKFSLLSSSSVRNTRNSSAQNAKLPPRPEFYMHGGNRNATEAQW